jgi:predicted nuclease of restriction endonuclease-like (RecB) superfamily
MKNNNDILHNNYDNLKNEIGLLLQKGREQAGRAVNTILLQTYWNIGRHIVEFEQKGETKAEYGSELIDRLSKDLTLEFGKGFSRSNLIYIRKFYLCFPKSETLSHQLSWSHYFEIIKSENGLEISFYLKQCEIENWSVRELRRQMKSMLFHRLALSKDKKGILEIANKGVEVLNPLDIIKDPYIFEFLNIQQKEKYLEGELEEKLINNLEDFLLEFGNGFAFIGRQYKISLSNRHFFVDLVFYHRILKCFVLIDLKRGEIEHNDIGQMNMYLNYFNKEENVEDDNPPIGIVLGAYKDTIMVEYATSGITNQLFVSKYQLYLPDRKQLQQELERLMFSE